MDHREQLRPGFGQSDRTRPTMEKGNTAKALEHADLVADCCRVTPSSDAARLKLRCRATASKARNSIRGGKLCTQKFYINPIHQKLKSLKFTRPALPVLLPKSIRHQGCIMVDQTIASTHGTPVTLSTTKVERFASGLAGSLLRRSDRDYDQARRVWNAMVDKRPALSPAVPAPPTLSRVSALRASTTC